MSVIPMRTRKRSTRPSARRKAQRVYAIAFDLDTIVAEQLCGSSWRGCYEKTAQVLGEFGFARQQGSVYFGDETTDAVTCVMAVQEADKRFPWFGRVVRDLRMLRVDEDNDLLPALNNQLRLNDGKVA